jgi:predicted RNase H-like nuclease
VLQKAESIAGAAVDLVAIDMPIARTKITGRRVSDNAISVAFSAQWASTHSPNEMRPGSFGERIANSFAKAGYRLGTDSLQVTAGRALVEVYPLVALVRLMNPTVRPAYKVAKLAKYYRNIVPPLSKEQRIGRLLETWAEMLTALGREIFGPIPLLRNRTGWIPFDRRRLQARFDPVFRRGCANRSQVARSVRKRCC